LILTFTIKGANTSTYFYNLAVSVHLVGFYLSRIRMFNENVRLFIAGQFLAGFGMAFWSLLFNLYLQELGLTKDRIGITLAIANFATAIIALPAGIYISRHSQKLTLIFSQLLFPLLAGTAIFLVGPSFLILLFLAYGFATFMRVIAGPFIMANTTHKERTYVFSVYFITTVIGGVLGNLMGGSLQQLFRRVGIEAVVGYRWAILVGIFLIVLAIVPYFFIKEENRIEKPARFHLRDMAAWNWPLFIRALIPSVLVSIGAGIVLQFVNLYFKDTFHLPDSAIGSYMSLQAFAMAAGAVIVPSLAERFGKVTTIVGTQLLSIPFMLVLAFTGDIHIAIIALTIRSGLMNMANPVSNTLLFELCKPTEQAVINSLLIMFSGLAWSISSLAFGRFLKGNYSESFIVAVVLYFISSLLYYYFFRSVEIEDESLEAIELIKQT